MGTSKPSATLRPPNKDIFAQSSSLSDLLAGSGIGARTPYLVSAATIAPITRTIMAFTIPVVKSPVAIQPANAPTAAIPNVQVHTVCCFGDTSRSPRIAQGTCQIVLDFPPFWLTVKKRLKKRSLFYFNSYARFAKVSNPHTWIGGINRYISLRVFFYSEARLTKILHVCTGIGGING